MLNSRSSASPKSSRSNWCDDVRYPGFLGPSYLGRSYMADTERCVNFYLEKNETPNAPSPYCLLPTPGFTLIVEVAEGPIRAAATAGTRTFFVAGFTLYELNSDDTATARGVVQSDENPATICWNGAGGDQLFITSGDVGYCYELSTDTLTEVLASGAAMGSFLDGFFLSLDAATGTLRISDLLDGAVWDPTQIVQRTAGADPWVCMTVIHTQIWLMGPLTSEVWNNAGLSPFPFAPIPGAFLEQGIAAPFSAIRDVAPLLWLSQNAQGAKQFMLAEGYNGSRVSTHGIETQVSRYDDITDCVSMGFQLDGHTFFAATFADADRTWLYDSTEGAWTEWLYWNSATSEYEAIRVGSHVYANGRHLVGDRATGAIYEMRLDVYTDVDGVAIRRMRQPPRISAENQNRLTIHEITLVMDVGIGLLSGQGSDPQVMRRASRDGGRTWGPEKWESAGAIGRYNTRVKWQPCGGGMRNYVDQFIFSDPVPFKISNAEIDYSEGIN